MATIASRIFTPLCQLSLAAIKIKKGRAKATLLVACPDGKAGVSASENALISPAYSTKGRGLLRTLLQNIPANPRNTENQEDQ